MFTHADIWDAIEALARHKEWSLARLSTRAGLDPTALGRSKRFGPEGKTRWPSTETLAKLLGAAEIGFGEFCHMVSGTVAQPIGQRADILLVDDDPEFCRNSADTLRRAGYAVLASSNQRDVLDWLDSDGPLDLLCTDIVMPDGFGGMALAEHARTKRPELKILYVTGYDIPTVDAAAAILRKPVGGAALVHAVNRLLAPPPADG